LETSGGQSSYLYLNAVHFFNISVNWTSVAAQDSCFLTLVFNTCCFIVLIMNNSLHFYPVLDDIYYWLVWFTFNKSFAYVGTMSEHNKDNYWSFLGGTINFVQSLPVL
jgi:hypothetical protein